jgi:hypothetical protein
METLPVMDPLDYRSRPFTEQHVVPTLRTGVLNRTVVSVAYANPTAMYDSARATPLCYRYSWWVEIPH